MELIGYHYNDNPNIEENFKARFTLMGQSKKQAWLVIANLTPTDSAEYFCAASRHSASTLWVSSQKAGGPITCAPAPNLKCFTQ